MGDEDDYSDFLSIFSRPRSFFPSLDELVRRSAALTSCMASVDTVENSDGLYITADLPGVPREALRVQLDEDGRRLTIGGEPAPPKLAPTADSESGKRLFVHRERCQGKFVDRSVRLSPSLDTSQISGTYKDGRLEIAIPRKNTSGSHPATVPISFE